MSHICWYLATGTSSLGFKEGVPFKYKNKLPVVIVPVPGKGVCADPLNGAAILGKEGPDPQGRNKGRQSRPDKGREKT